MARHQGGHGDWCSRDEAEKRQSAEHDVVRVAAFAAVRLWDGPPAERKCAVAPRANRPVRTRLYMMIY